MSALTQPERVWRWQKQAAQEIRWVALYMDSMRRDYRYWDETAWPTTPRRIGRRR